MGNFYLILWPNLSFQVDLHYQTRVHNVKVLSLVLVLQVHGEGELCQVDLRVDV